MRKKAPLAGFTLIELLIVFSLITLLASFSIPAFITYNRRQQTQDLALKITDAIKETQNLALGGVQAAGNFTSKYQILLDHQAGDPADVFRGYSINRLDGNGDVLATISTQQVSCLPCLKSSLDRLEFKVPTGAASNLSSYQHSLSVCYPRMGTYAVTVDQSGRVYRGDFQTASCTCPAGC
jgi:Tfp pilus assembly protein FimT